MMMIYLSPHFIFDEKSAYLKLVFTNNRKLGPIIGLNLLGIRRYNLCLRTNLKMVRFEKLSFEIASFVGDLYDKKPFCFYI